MKISLENTTEKQKITIASLVILIIALIYIHPFFLGKIDTPLDIRDALMYPWRYHSVDKKIKIHHLWGVKDSIDLKVLPNSTNTSSLALNIDESMLQELANRKKLNYHISFDFKPVTTKGEKLNFGLSVKNNRTSRAYTPGVAVSPLNSNNNNEAEWYKAYFDLNSFVSNLSSIEDLNSYSIQITVLNKNTSNPGSLYIKNLNFSCEDFSDVTNIHNYFINDLVQMFTPFREYFSSSLKKGQLPFWNNYAFSGTEFLSEPQVGYFHPVYFLSYFLFDHFTAHAIIIFASLVLGGIGTFLLTQYWGFGFGASLFTSLVYMFQPFNATWFSYEHMIMNSATLPFLLLSYEKNLKNNDLLNKHLLISALLTGLIFLSGHFQYVYYTMVFFLLFAFFRLITNCWSDKKQLFKNLFSVSFIISFGLLIGMIVIVPFFPLFSNSYRIANSISFVKETSIPIRALLGLIYPYYGGHPSFFHTELSKEFDPDYRIGFFNNYVYFGFLPFLFALLSFITLTKNKLTMFFIVSVLVSLLVCMGSPLFFLVRDYIPGFKEMQHFRFLQVFSYSVPFLAGIGFNVCSNYFTSLKNNFKKTLFILVFLISAIDLMHYASYFVTWSNKSDYKPIPKGGSLEFLLKEKEQSSEPFRILPFAVDKVGETKLKVNVAQPNTLLPYGLEEVSGYSSFVPRDIYYLFVYIQSLDPGKLYPKELSYFFTNPNIPYPIFNFKSKILDLLNVKYFLVPNVLTLDSENTEKVFTGDCSIYKNKDFLPRAFIVPDYEVIEYPKGVIISLENENFDPRRKVILMSLPEGVALKEGSAIMPIQYEIKFEKYEQNNITLMVETNGAGFLVLGNNLNNNWKVKINKKNADHYQANLVQRAVYLNGPGTYNIEFYYFPKLFLIGLTFTLSGLFVLLFCALYLRFRVKQGRQEEVKKKPDKVLVKA